MDASLSPGNNVRWIERREILQPKASGLGFAVAELPRLNDLIRLPNAGGNDRNRVLNRDPRDGRRQQEPDKLKGRGLFRLLEREPPRTASGKVRARRVGHHQVPAIAKYIANVTLVVGAGNIGREKIAGHGVMTRSGEGIADAAAVLAGYKDSHSHPAARSAFWRATMPRSRTTITAPQAMTTTAGTAASAFMVWPLL